MVMDSLLSILFFLFSLFVFNSAVSSFASKLSYKEHCASIVPESTPIGFSLDSFPLGLGYHQLGPGYFTGGDRIMDVGTPLQRSLIYVYTGNIHASQATGLFQIESNVSFRSTNPYYYQVGDHTRRGYRRVYVTFELAGFWSESSGKVCMVGTGRTKTGNSLNLDAVFKLSNVFNASNISSSLITGSLESLSSQNDENYFEPFSVMMLAIANYKHTLDSIEAENKCSSGSDAVRGIAVNPISFCSFVPPREIARLQLEYSTDCNSSKNCTPFSSGISEQLPSLMSLKGFDCCYHCCYGTKKCRLRVLMGFFSDISDSYTDIHQGFNPKTMLVGEGWWDEKKNTLCVVACPIMGMASSSLSGAHVGDCSIRLTLRFPSIWSIKNTSRTVGQMWSNKTSNYPGYFKRITFRSYEDQTVAVGVRGLKYEYSQLDRVRHSCPIHKKPAKNQGGKYPNAFSYNMRFEMSVTNFNRKVAWGYSTPLSVGDQFFVLDLHTILDFGSNSPVAASPIVSLSSNTSSLFNISYKISMSLMSNLTIGDRNSLFNMSSERVKISAEGIYDAGTGTLCMVGCRDLLPNDGTPIAPSMDCEILVRFQFPPLDRNKGSYIQGRIESTRKESDPLYFKSLDLSSTAFYRKEATEIVWGMDT